MISIIVVHYNAEGYLRTCIDSIRRSKGTRWELIIVDNGSMNAERLSAEFPEATWIQNDRNLGWGSAINLGAQAARGDILVLLNPDTELTPDSLAALATFFGEHSSSNLGPVGGRLMFTNGNHQPSCGPFPGLMNLVWRRLALSSTHRRYYIRHSPSSAVVDWVTGAFMAVRRNVFERLKGFDPEFFLYYEDVDFCRRARENGMEVHYVPEASAYHHNPHAIRPHNPDLQRIIQTSRRIYFRKHRPAWEGSVLSVLHKIESLA